MNLLKIGICAAVISFSTVGIVVAESSGWMTASQMKNYEKKIRKQKKKFSRLFCANSNSNPNIKPKILLRAITRSNRSNRPWGWAVGRSVLNSGIKFEKKGMSRKSLHTSIESKRYRFQCAVWG